MKLFAIFLLLIGLAAPISAVGSADTQTAPAKSGASKKKAKAPSAALQALAASLTSAQRIKLMNLVNEGGETALAILPGVGPVRATAIKATRPFAAPLDLIRVPGIGEGTLTEILTYAKAGFPVTPPKPKAPAKKKSPANKPGTEEQK